MSEAERPEQTSGRGPWGFWATIAFGLVITSCFVIVQLVVVLLLASFWGPAGPAEMLRPGPAAHTPPLFGLFFSIASFAAAPVCIWIILFFVWLRRGPSAGEYLRLEPVSIRTMLKWLAIALAVSTAGDAVMSLLGESVIPDFMISLYKTAGFIPLLWLALIVAAPLTEEFLFRGFLFEGFARSRIGAAGAVALTSAAWTALHFQYNITQLTALFSYGIVLGIARLQTGSLWVPVGVHAFINLIATIQVAVLIARQSS